MRVIGFALIGQQQNRASSNASCRMFAHLEQVMQLHPIFVGQTDFVYESHSVLLLSVSIPQGEALHQI
jgi:hypothetical protein